MVAVFKSIMNRVFQQKSADPKANVEEILMELASRKGAGGYWRSSIVELLELLDLDSSLDSRKALAEELDVHVGPPGSPQQNLELQKAVWRALQENGGRVPPALVW